MNYPFPGLPAAQNSRLDWQPPVWQIYGLLLVAMAAGGIACFYLAPLFAAEGGTLVLAYASGTVFLLLGILGTMLQWAQSSIPVRILILLALALLHATVVAALVAATQLREDPAQTQQAMQTVLWGGAAIAVLGTACFLPQVRQWLAAGIPFAPAKFAHAFVLAACVAATGWALLSLVPFQEPLLYGMIEDGMPATEPLDSPLMTNVSLVSITVWSIPAAFLAVGFGVSRNLRQTLTRLGIEYTSLRHVAIGVLTAILLVGAGLLLNPLIQGIWTYFGWPVTDLQAFAELSNLPVDPLGMLILGVSAGVSEELLVRGVLQPRLGLFLANVLFALAHAFQYAADGLLVVLCLGLVFGLVRQRWGLVPAIIGHALYDIILLGLAVLMPDAVF